MKTATLGDVADYINGAAFKESDWEDNGRRIIRIQNLNDPKKPYNRTTKQVKDTIVVRPGDLLVSWSASLGVYEWSEPEEAVLNQHIFRVIPDLSVIDHGYLRRVLEWSIDKLSGQTHGATMKHLTRKVFLAFPIPLPPIEEQRRIAAVLDAADDLRTKRRQALAKLDTLTQAIFIDMFGDPGANADRHNVRSLIEIVDPDRPITYGILKPGDDIDDGVPYVRVVDMVEGGVNHTTVRRTSPAIAEQYKRSTLVEGDLLLSIRGHVGRMAVTPPELNGANITQDTARLAVSGAEPIYVLACMRSASLQHWMKTFTKGAAVRGINLWDVKKMPIPLPRTEHQREFVDRANVIQESRPKLIGSAGVLDALFASLQQQAFAGEL